MKQEAGAFTPRRSLALAATRFLPPNRFWRLRTRLLRAGGYGGIDRRVILADTPRLQGSDLTGPHLSIGEGTYVNVDCLIDLRADVVIGDHVAVGQRVSIITETHEVGDRLSRAATRCAAPVHIGDGCWIGAGVTILPGVTIGERSVIAAGAVVSDDIEANVVAAGVPAKPIRDLD